MNWRGLASFKAASMNVVPQLVTGVNESSSWNGTFYILHIMCKSIPFVQVPVCAGNAVRAPRSRSNEGLFFMFLLLFSVDSIAA